MLYFERKKGKGNPKEIKGCVKNPLDLPQTIVEIEALNAAYERGELRGEGELSKEEVDRLVRRHNAGDGASATKVSLSSPAYHAGYDAIFGRKKRKKASEDN